MSENRPLDLWGKPQAAPKVETLDYNRSRGYGVREEKKRKKREARDREERAKERAKEKEKEDEKRRIKEIERKVRKIHGLDEGVWRRKMNLYSIKSFHRRNHDAMIPIYDPKNTREVVISKQAANFLKKEYIDELPPKLKKELKEVMKQYKDTAYEDEGKRSKKGRDTYVPQAQKRLETLIDQAGPKSETMKGIILGNRGRPVTFETTIDDLTCRYGLFTVGYNSVVAEMERKMGGRGFEEYPGNGECLIIVDNKLVVSPKFKLTEDKIGLENRRKISGRFEEWMDEYGESSVKRDAAWEQNYNATQGGHESGYPADHPSPEIGRNQSGSRSRSRSRRRRRR
jgi:hypothetical protein